MKAEEVPPELVQLAQARLVEEYGGHGWPGDVGARELLAEAITRWEQIRPQVCPFDCDSCHDDDQCPCERLGCAGYQEKACVPQECPPFQEMNLDVTRMWFGNEHGWLTHDEAVQRGFRDELGAQPIMYRVNDDG